MTARYFNPTYYGCTYEEALEELARNGDIFKDRDGGYYIDAGDAGCANEVKPPGKRTPEDFKRGNKTYLVSLGIRKPLEQTYSNYNNGDRGHVWLESIGYGNSDKHFHFGTFYNDIAGSNKAIGTDALYSDAKASMSDRYVGKRTDYAVFIPVSYQQWRLLDIDRKIMQLRAPGYNAVTASCEGYALQCLHDVGIDLEEILGKPLSTVPFSALGIDTNQFHDTKLQALLLANPELEKITTLTLADDMKSSLDKPDTIADQSIRYRKVDESDSSPVIVDLTAIKEPVRLHNVAHGIKSEEVLPTIRPKPDTLYNLPTDVRNKVRTACMAFRQRLLSLRDINYTESYPIADNGRIAGDLKLFIPIITLHDKTAILLRSYWNG